MAEYIDLSNPILFHENLEPVAAKLLDRHMNTTKEWFPHELVSYSQGQDFGKGYEWSESESRVIDPAVRSALFVNLLTEDNLPYYFRDIERMFGMESAFGVWNKRWTAEEGRHSIVIRDYLTATRAIDPVALERARMAQVMRGETPQPPDAHYGVIYVSLQELATRVAHRNTGKLVGDTSGYDVMSRVAADENLHYLFYKDLAAAAIELNPSQMVTATEDIVRNFEMPGTGIIDYEKHKALIALRGIYGATEQLQVFDDVIKKQWRFEKLENLTPEAEKARVKIFRRMDAIGKVALKEQELREAYAAQAVA